MAKYSNSEKQKRFRQQLKADETKWAAHKEKERERLKR